MVLHSFFIVVVEMEKKYLAKLIAAGVHARDKIVLCMASIGLKALFHPGGHTAHL